jgi:hypothetical protein
MTLSPQSVSRRYIIGFGHDSRGPIFIEDEPCSCKGVECCVMWPINRAVEYRGSLLHLLLGGFCSVSLFLSDSDCHSDEYQGQLRFAPRCRAIDISPDMADPKFPASNSASAYNRDLDLTPVFYFLFCAEIRGPENFYGHVKS